MALPACSSLIVALVVCLVLLAGPRPAAAQMPPDGRWETRTTAHFRVTYPAHLSRLGARAAARAEAAHRLLAETFVEAPDGRIDVVVTDHTDASNGFARVFPTNQAIAVAAPPTDGLSLSYFDDWLDLVLVHELAHVFHLNEIGTPGSIVRALFGRLPLSWPTFPGLATPHWTREGLATWYESALTTAGRADGTYFEMMLRTAALEEAFEELDEASGTSPVWPDGERAYAYGSLFFSHLLEEHGPEKMRDFARAVAGQWIPYRLNAAADDAFGIDFGAAWSAWREEREETARARADSLAERAPITAPEGLATHGRWALRPSAGPSGDTIAYLRSDGRSEPGIQLLSPDSRAGRDVGRTNGLADFAWTPDGDLLVAQYEHTGRYRLRSDLYRFGRDGDVRRLTRGARLDQPDVAPDGSVAVAVQEGEGTNRLVEVDLRDGSFRVLVPFDPEVHWAYPQISPHGRWIAVSRWRSGGRHFDVVLLDRTGGLVHRISRRESVDLAPTWSPDGRWLVWSSDRSGIWNLLAVPVDATDGTAGTPRQLTNMLTGAAFPSVGREGRWLYFSGYHADGWHVERIPFEPESGIEPFPLDPRFRAPASDERIVREERLSGSAGPEQPGTDSVGTVGPYRAGPTVLPRYWLPSLRVAEETRDGSGRRVEVLSAAYGARTSGRDVLGRHSYGVEAAVAPGSGRFEGALGYAYSGLGNPVVGLGISQSWDAPARAVQARDEEGVQELFPVERERALTVATNFVRRRYRDELSLELGVGYVRERRSFLTRELEESARFRPVRRHRNLLEAAATLAGDGTQRHAFSISPEDGGRGFLRLRAREELGLPDSLTNVAGLDRSFQEAVAGVRLYRGFSAPGFANHVLALRGAAGVARGPGADALHFEVGGASGRPEPLTGAALFGGSSLLFPVRGYAAGARIGRFAWSTSAEYRFPLLLVHEGLSLLPIHLDRISGSVFFDAGNAWGPRLGGEPSRFQNERRPALASAGAELAFVVLPLWSSDLTVRAGSAFPFRQRSFTSPAAYVRIGISF